MVVDKPQNPLDFITMSINSDTQRRRFTVEQEACSKKSVAGNPPQSAADVIDFEKLVTPLAYSVNQYCLDVEIPLDDGVSRRTMDRGWASVLDTSRPYAAGLNPRSISAPEMHCYDSKSDISLAPRVGDNSHNPKSC